jgi:hypothetical protein
VSHAPVRGWGVGAGVGMGWGVEHVTETADIECFCATTVGTGEVHMRTRAVLARFDPSRGDVRA